MASPTSTLPQRSATTATRSTTMSDEDTFADEDTSETTRLFGERLQAWKHACGYLEDYIKAQEKYHHSSSKDFEKVLKTVSQPLKEGHHFDQQLGGVAGMFESLRSNTQGISHSHAELAKVLKGTVLPIFERLHAEVKSKSKELTKGAGKASKQVDKARNTTQAHIEKLGQHSAAFNSTGGKVAANDDPYLLHRQVRHRLNKQIIEENNARLDMITVQNNFAQFEAHVLQMIQEGLGQFNLIVGKQLDQEKMMYGDITGTSQRIPPDFEWNGFVKRNSGLLIDPEAPPRSFGNATFPNMDHPSTQALIQGTLERRSKLMRSYKNYFYVATPSKYLHEFETDDDLTKDPTPDISLFLPDCVVGALDGTQFTIKGKDLSKGKLGVNISTTHEYHLKANTASDAQQWHHIIKSAAGQITAEFPESFPNSPTTATGSQSSTLNSSVAPHDAQRPAVQTQGLTGGENVASPAQATPASATVPGVAAGHPTSAAPGTTTDKI